MRNVVDSMKYANRTVCWLPSAKDKYYDDEELDKYIGIAPEDYTLEQEDEFRDVFYTMQDTDVAGWVRSLQLRGIALPDNIKDEIFLIIGERRS